MSRRRALHLAACLALTMPAACSDPSSGRDASLDAPTDSPADDVTRIDTSIPSDVQDARVDLDADDAAPPVDASDASPPADVFHVDASMPDGTWRSALFPADWQPVHAGGAPDAMGRYLPDFSYAGYHRGEQRPPVGAGTVVATVAASLGDGMQDATSVIQSAITTACMAGGGVVRLPAGLYRVRLPSDTAGEAIRIGCSHVVLRGDGPAMTRILFDDARRARSKSVIAIRGTGAFFDGSGTTTRPLTADALLPTTSIALASTTGLAAGDWVVVRNNVTDGFRADHRMDDATSGLTGLWPTAQFRGIAYPRRVVSVSASGIVIDEPTHYPLRTRDNARVYEITNFVEESGVEALAIGMVENRTSAITEPGSDDDYMVANTTGYEVHDARGITFDRAHDAWLDDVDTFQPAGNTSGAHVLSHGVFVAQGAFRITVSHCDFGRSQYRGGGGNGYLFHLQGNDVLVVDSSATHARHGFTTNQSVTGSVFLRDLARTSRLANDTHRFLSHAILYDNVRLDGDWLQCVNRGTTSSGAGFTGTQLVYWNTVVVRNPTIARGCAIESAQWGHGYLIGSQAEGTATARLCPTSFSNGTWASLDQGAPADYLEGESMGATLYPASLYEAQRALRCARDGIACDP